MQQVTLAYSPCPTPTPRVVPIDGGVAFASAEEQEQRSVELVGAGALLVRLPPPTAHVRGHLGGLLEELVERELARVGAPSPYLAAWTAMPDEANARLADQLSRARAVGASGLAMALGTLAHIASPSLCTDDSALLRWLAEATTALPLVLLIDDSDVHLTGYAAPQPLMDLLVRHDAPVVLRGDDATAVEAVVASIDVGEAIVGAAHGAADGAPDGDAAPNAESSGEPTDGAEVVHAVSTAGPGTSSVPKSVTVGGEAVRDAAIPRAEAVRDAAIPRAEAVQEPAAGVAARMRRAASAAALLAQAQTGEPAPVAEFAAASNADANANSPANARARRMRTARSAVAGAIESTPNDAWRTWALALSAARGPQPLAAFERLFAESYVPLVNAIAGGLDDARAVRAFDEFRRSFERSYTDAFATFGATNRRPRLVMDAFDLAAKNARLVGARSAHIVLVDSMRYDLGVMVRDNLAREAAGVATLGTETLLWSALPTTTMRQLETLARGMDAIRAPSSEEPSESLRGRAAEVVRRMRLGSREVYKLDLVPSMLDAAGVNAIAELPVIAQAVAEAIARHVTTLVPRTLLYIVGDHGFTVDRKGHVQTGGASPEEVLVPAQSWLVGDLH